jgi:hypothetical protein
MQLAAARRHHRDDKVMIEELRQVENLHKELASLGDK